MFIYFFFCRKVAKIESINREAVNDPEHYLGHPVNGYLLVKRFLWEWAEIENNVRLDKPKTGRYGVFALLSCKLEHMQVVQSNRRPTTANSVLRL